MRWNPHPAALGLENEPCFLGAAAAPSLRCLTGGGCRIPAQGCSPVEMRSRSPRMGLLPSALPCRGRRAAGPCAAASAPPGVVGCSLFPVTAGAPRGQQHPSRAVVLWSLAFQCCCISQPGGPPPPPCNSITSILAGAGRAAGPPRCACSPRCASRLRAPLLASWGGGGR